MSVEADPMVAPMMVLFFMASPLGVWIVHPIVSKAFSRLSAVGLFVGFARLTLPRVNWEAGFGCRFPVWPSSLRFQSEGRRYLATLAQQAFWLIRFSTVDHAPER